MPSLSPCLAHPYLSTPPSFPSVGFCQETPGVVPRGGGQPRWAVCATVAGAHSGQTSRKGEGDIWWTVGTARGGAGHLGLTHTETQRGRLWTACGQRRVDGKNSRTTPATTSTSSIRQLLRKLHTMPHPAQPRHTNYWAPRTRKRHQQEHRPQRLTERSDPTQYAKGRTGDCPGPRKETTTGRNVTRGGGVNLARGGPNGATFVHVYLGLGGMVACRADCRVPSLYSSKSRGLGAVHRVLSPRVLHPALVYASVRLSQGLTHGICTLRALAGRPDLWVQLCARVGLCRARPCAIFNYSRARPCNRFFGLESAFSAGRVQPFL